MSDKYIKPISIGRVDKVYHDFVKVMLLAIPNDLSEHGVTITMTIDDGSAVETVMELEVCAMYLQDMTECEDGIQFGHIAERMSYEQLEAMTSDIAKALNNLYVTIKEELLHGQK